MTRSQDPDLDRKLFKMQAEVPAAVADIATRTVSYLITLRSGDGSRQIRSNGKVPDCWLPLKTMIEKISRICFFV